MTESTQLQTAENNNAGVVKMEPLPPATTASTANTTLATSPAPSSVMEQQQQQLAAAAAAASQQLQAQTASILSATQQLHQQQQLQQQQQQQQYALKWNDYQTSMLSSFRHLRDEEDFVDVTLACDERSFTAHKVVLSACSPYFRKLLKANPCEHPIVILRDVPADDVEHLLSFMYNGEVNVGHEHLPEFLKTAHLLQIRGLADVNGGNAFNSAALNPAAKTLSNALSSSNLSGSTNKLNFLTAATQALSNNSNSPFTTPSLGTSTPLNSLLNNTNPSANNTSSNSNNNNTNTNTNSNNNNSNSNNNNNSSSNNSSSNNNNNSSSNNNGKTPAIQELKASSASPANHWDLSDSDSNRNNHLTPPPQKRIKSADLFRAQHGISPERLLIDREFPVAGQHPLTRNRDRSRETSRDREREREMRESLLGQALENSNGLQKQHTDMSSIHAQSVCEDSNSSDTEPSDRGDGQNEGTMDSMDNQRSHSFPNAFLGLQGIPGLLPGPSGMGANDFASDVQQNLGKFLSTTQIKEELKDDEEPKVTETIVRHKEEPRSTESPSPLPLALEQKLREYPDEVTNPELASSHLNHKVAHIKTQSANSSPARSMRSWHDSDDENFMDDDGASSVSSAISLTMKTSRQNSESTLYQALLKKQQHQQQQTQQRLTDQEHQMQQRHQQQQQQQQQQHQNDHQQQQQQQQQQHNHQQQQQYLDELQQSAAVSAHQQQLTANLLMARTIAFSRSRDFPDLFQNPAAVAAAAAAAATASAASANAAAAAANNSNYMLPCPLCETPLEQRVFRQHLDRHYPRDSPVCPVIECGRRFAHPNSVRNHMRIKHTLQWAKMKAMRSSGGPFAGGPDFK